MNNLKELNKEELLNINGGNLFYDIFYAFGKACVYQAEHAQSGNGGKYGGSFHY